MSRHKKTDKKAVRNIQINRNIKACQIDKHLKYNNQVSYNIYDVGSDGRKDKRSCVYYCKDSQKCINDKCSVIYCVSASGCGSYKRRNKGIKSNNINNDNKGSLIDSIVIHDNIASVKDNINYSNAISKNIGTNCHVGYLKRNDKRRHKTRCIYYDKVKKWCLMLVCRCVGSNRCGLYKED